MKFSRIKWRWLGVPVLAAAMLLVSDTSEANAQGFSLQIGRFGISNYGGGYGYNRGFGGYNSYQSFRPSYHYGTPVYRSHYRSYHPARPHYDYHPPSLVPHGNHFDYVPGHYDFHYGGHHGHRGHH
jgi:hypothetical protein